MSRLGREGAGQADALLHAAAEFVGELVGELVEPHQLDLLVDDALALGLGDAADVEAEADIVAHRQPRHQAELLEHHGDAVAAQAAQRLRIAAGDIDLLVAVMHQHLAAR